MSKNFKGYMGDQIGKLGPAVGRRWKNRMVYSSYQGKVKNPKTPEQQIVRARFAALSNLATEFTTAFMTGMGLAAKNANVSERNLFFRKNWDAVRAEAPESVTVGYSAMALSWGSLKGVTFSGARFDEALTVKANFTANQTSVKTDASDEVYIFAYAPEVDEGVLSAPANRDDGTLSMSVPSGWNGLTVHVWGFTVGGKKGLNKGLASMTSYIGNGTIA